MSAPKRPAPTKTGPLHPPDQPRGRPAARFLTKLSAPGTVGADLEGPAALNGALAAAGPLSCFGACFGGLVTLDPIDPYALDRLRNAAARLYGHRAADRSLTHLGNRE
ncbi:hypothetical protein Ssi02_25920 [Sinosporangium siamense]|uniref:Uncharacterized protein n=1 Tax=Sinosporangium siamense TaxID=1367973 RepID=A0A919RED3_9ACTN|nr:hypothetical protein Ssi02_25920 [Sinosporangium siamense]